MVTDQTEPLSIAGPLVEEHNLQDRITLLEGDFFETDLGTDYDVVLTSGVVLIKPEDDCRRLKKGQCEQFRPGNIELSMGSDGRVGYLLGCGFHGCFHAGNFTALH